MDELLTDISKFMAQHELSESQFGEIAANDRRLLNGLKEGRDVGMRLVARIKHVLEAYPNQDAYVGRWSRRPTPITKAA